jgi:hypothetical protein
VAAEAVVAAVNAAAAVDVVEAEEEAGRGRVHRAVQGRRSYLDRVAASVGTAAISQTKGEGTGRCNDSLGIQKQPLCFLFNVYRAPRRFT